MKKLPKIALISSVIFAFGIFLAFYFGNQTERKITQQATSYAQSITAAINPERFNSLSLSSYDKQNPDYLRLREQLNQISILTKSEGIRWIYTVVKKNYKIIFAVDSIPEDEFGHSEPGDVYADAPLELLEVFNTESASISRPYIDEWGSFVSVFVPIKDFKTGELKAVVGFDIDQSFLASRKNQQITIILSVTFLVGLTAVSVFLFFNTRYENFAALKESEERFKTITTSSLDPIIMMNRAGEITFWNLAAEKMFGYTEKEVKAKNLHSIIAPKDKYPVNSSINLSSFKKTGTSPIFGEILELEAIDKNNRVFPIELSVAPIKINRDIFALGVVRDITQRKKTEDLLRSRTVELEDSQKAILNVLEDVEEERARFKALLSGIGDGVIAVDKNYRIIYANQASEELLGWKIGEMIGRMFDKIIGIEDSKGRALPRRKRPFTFSIQSGRKIFTSVDSPNFYYRKNETKFPVAITVTPIITNGKIVGAIDVFRDITHEIEVDKMKTEFISLASHQLRTPLSSMKWYSEMLLNGDAGQLQKEQTDFVNNIYKSNERMIDLVNSLLNISRIESGRISITPVPVKIGDLIANLIAELKQSFWQKEQSVSIKIQPRLGKIKLDPRLISEVYKNLLTNANKYTPAKGKIKIIISKKGKEVVSEVSDTGYGIPPKDQTAIFSKFHRADNVVKLETEGTGLGLYMAKAIVESSGGKIWFKSVEGKGTTFWFTLPVEGVKPKRGEVSLQ